MTSELARQSNADSVPPRRAWYRLHRCTWIASLMVAVVLTILVVPGEVQHVSQGANGLFLRLQHGWPWPYLEHTYSFPYPPPQLSELPRGPAWINAWAWSGRGGADRAELKKYDHVVWKNLACDILIAVTMLALLAIVVEWQRRRRRRPVIQWTLRELLVAMTVVVCLLAWYQVWRSRLVDGNRAIQELEALTARAGDSIDQGNPHYVGPVWLTRLLSCRTWAFQAPTAITYAKTGAPVTAADIEPLLPALARLQHLDNIGIRTDSDIEASALRAIATITTIESLTLTSTRNSLRLSADKLRALGRMRDLTTLKIGGGQEIRDAQLLGELSNLEVLSISCAQIDDRQLAFLAKLRNLECLHLDDVPCDDGAVHRICNLKGLRRLSVCCPGISREGFGRLHAAFPDCDLYLRLESPEKPAKK